MSGPRVGEAGLQLSCTPGVTCLRMRRSCIVSFPRRAGGSVQVQHTLSAPSLVSRRCRRNHGCSAGQGGLPDLGFSDPPLHTGHRQHVWGSFRKPNALCER